MPNRKSYAMRKRPSTTSNPSEEPAQRRNRVASAQEPTTSQEASTSQVATTLQEVTTPQVATTSQVATISEDTMARIVAQVTDQVTQRLVPLLSGQNPQVSSDSQSGQADAVEGAVVDAVNAAQQSISGELPRFQFQSSSLPLDSRVSPKIRQKIWDHEYVDFGSLLVSHISEDQFRLNVTNTGQQGPSLSLEPISKTKKNWIYWGLAECFSHFRGYLHKPVPKRSATTNEICRHSSGIG